MKILVTGAKGQLGQELQKEAKNLNDLRFYFYDKEKLDITNESQVILEMKKINPDYVINAAAYTAVDKAEEEKEKAYLINADALKNICNGGSYKIIHISTDYVYHSNHKILLTEDMSVDPIGVYAKSKLAGEQILRTCCNQALIIRTSWVYSSFGKNFVKTILRLGKCQDQLSVINDQIGSPTYAGDLARTLLFIIQLDISGKILPRQWNDTYNYSNRGIISWYEFAKEILMMDGNTKTQISPISTPEYSAPATRPAWSVMDTSKIVSTFNVKIIDWKVSLAKCMSILVN